MLFGGKVGGKRNGLANARVQVDAFLWEFLKIWSLAIDGDFDRQAIVSNSFWVRFGLMYLFADSSA